MKSLVISFALILQACGSNPSLYRNIECMDKRTNHSFVFNTGKITSVTGFGYGKGPFFVKDYKNEYILIDYVATSFLTCSEKMFIDEDTNNYESKNVTSHKT